MAIGWEGRLTRLVPLDKEKHLANAVEWFNDPEITAWITQGDFPLSKAAEEAFFDRVTKPDGTDVPFAIETLEGMHIGFTGTHSIDWRHGTGTTGSVIGVKEYWGKGYGSDAGAVRTKYLFEVAGLRLLTSTVMGGNERSQRMLAGLGYREVGRIPERWWKRGTWRDEVVFALHRRWWEEKRDREGEDAAADVKTDPGDTAGD